MSYENKIASPASLAVAMIISSWQAQNKRLDTLIDKLSDEQLLKETAPGRNRGIYLLGHLAAVNDSMLPILGFGEKLYPHLEKIFITEADNLNTATPSLSELKDCWKTVNAKLDDAFATLNNDDWFSRHMLVSAEDFVKDPHRNKLNILISRATHQSYHLGQLAYLGELKVD
ncbi:hypothetical protein BH11BAC4_BH11BAC4_08160 [soil metagenome]